MMLSSEDIRALIQRIVGDSELQTEFRRAILPDDEYNLLKLVRELSVNVAGLSVTMDELARAQKRTEQQLRELAEAQRGSEERLGRLEVAMAGLAEAQRATEQQVRELAEAQRGSEERLGRLETAMAELAEAQRATEQQLRELADAQRGTEQQLRELADAQRGTEGRVQQLETAMAGLAEAQKQAWLKLARIDERIGVSTEQEAADMLGYVLRKKGYEILSGPFNLPLDGEIDVLYTVQDPEGKKFTAVLEAKTRLSSNAVDKWAKTMRSREFRQRLTERGYQGPYLVYVYGMRADPSAFEAAQKLGIGLITDRGEQIEPLSEMFSD